ncbi:hypothetical protein BDR04DRAFT_1154618 [Suillus decipiens]|nr:hypothetical protein BDR04DRAFT_1154618 [Suillus decipiens]
MSNQDITAGSTDTHSLSADLVGQHIAFGLFLALFIRGYTLKHTIIYCRKKLGDTEMCAEQALQTTCQLWKLFYPYLALNLVTRLRHNAFSDDVPQQYSVDVPPFKVQLWELSTVVPGHGRPPHGPQMQEASVVSESSMARALRGPTAANARRMIAERFI